MRRTRRVLRHRIDHIDEWAADHGETNQANALPLCGHHDRRKHRNRLRGRHDRHGRIHLVRTDGSVIKPLGARDPELAADDPIVRTLTWAEFATARSPHRGRVDPDAIVQIVELPAA
jgi:hypothetical protein